MHTLSADFLFCAAERFRSQTNLSVHNPFNDRGDVHQSMRVSTFGKMLAKFVFLVIAITLAIDVSSEADVEVE